MAVSNRNLILVISFLATTSGFAASEAGAEPTLPVESLYEQRTRYVVLQETDLSCGAAALATILRYQHGETLTEREVALGLIAREEYLAQPELVRIRRGFSLLDLKRYTDSLGYAGLAYGGMELGDLIAEAPAIIPIRLFNYNHFVVFRGVLRDSVLLADPAYGNRTMPVERFMKAWTHYAGIGKVGFVVKRRDGLIPPNRLAPRAREFPMFRSGA
jgi:predicted double-glycine peptidase